MSASGHSRGDADPRHYGRDSARWPQRRANGITAPASWRSIRCLCKDVQLTNVRGPFWADAMHCLIGEPACRQQNQPPRRLTADAYGGSLATNIELVHDTNPSYKIDVASGRREPGAIRERTAGRAERYERHGFRQLVDRRHRQIDANAARRGELHVVDANIYQLPPLVSMLKVLSNRTPDSTAFNRCDMQFAIQGEHVHFQQLEFAGRRGQPYGKGETDFNRRLDLCSIL